MLLAVTNVNEADEDDSDGSPSPVIIRAYLVTGSAFGTCFVEVGGEKGVTSDRLLEAADKTMAAEENLMAGWTLTVWKSAAH